MAERSFNQRFTDLERRLVFIEKKLDALLMGQTGQEITNMDRMAAAQRQRIRFADIERRFGPELERLASEHPTDTPQRLCERLAEEGFLAS